MEKLFEKLDNLKQALDDTECIKELKRMNEEIQKDEKLISLIEKYKLTKDERLKENIINKEIFQKYKKQENELNFLILEINQELKKITKKDKCGL